MDQGKNLFSPTPATPQEKIRTAYNMAFVNWQSFWAEAYRDQSFYLNNQWSPEERFYLQQEQRPDSVFNLTRSCVNMVTGYQRKHRLSTIVNPVHNSSNKTASIFTKCQYHTMRTGQGYYALSDSFKGALVAGLGWTGVNVDYRFDPESGDINYEFIPWNAIIPDPFFTKLDLSDCDFLIRRAYMSKTEAISKFPEHKKMIERMQGNMRDELFTFLPQQRIFQTQNLLCYTEYWEQQYEEVTMVVNPITLKQIEVTSKNRKQLQPLIGMPGVKSFKKQKPKMKFYAMLNNEVVNEQDNPYNYNRYPFVPTTCVYAPEYDLYQYKIQSLIRCIRDPQIEFNKMLSKINDSVNSQINTGWIVKKSRFDNPMDFYKTGQGRVIFSKDNGDVNGDAKQIIPTPLAQGLFELQELYNQLIMRICGVNETALGESEQAKVAAIEQLRQGAALVNLQEIFDNLRLSQEIVGNITNELIQNNWSPEKVFLVTKEQPTPEFYDKNFGKYDAVCVEAPLTETQQQLVFSQYLMMKQMGINIPDDVILKSMPIQNKDEVVESIQAQQQQQMQMAQAQQQAELQDKAVINDLLIKEGNLKVALAQEKLAKAEEDRAQAHYERAKALKEIESIDVDNANKYADTLLRFEEVDKLREEQHAGHST